MSVVESDSAVMLMSHSCLSKTVDRVSFNLIKTIVGGGFEKRIKNQRSQR